MMMVAPKSRQACSTPQTPLFRWRVLMERNLAEMHPSYFGLVMATGIVAIASHLLGFKWIGQILLWLSVVCYASLWLLILARLAFFPRAMLTDLADHNRGVGFFTVIAATSVVGSQFLL